jgi:hypothetical protein
MPLERRRYAVTKVLLGRAFYYGSKGIFLLIFEGKILRIERY